MLIQRGIGDYKALPEHFRRVKVESTSSWEARDAGEVKAAVKEGPGWEVHMVVGPEALTPAEILARGRASSMEAPGAGEGTP